MQRLQAFKYELIPTGEQMRAMRRFAGACRFVYNKALALQKDNHDAGNRFIGYVAMAKLLTAWRNAPDTPWLKDAPCHPLQHALKNLDTAYKNFFEKRAGFPRFKCKGRDDRFRYPDPQQIRLDQGNGRLCLPKLGWLRYRNSRAAHGTVRNVTISRSGDRWFASIQTQREVAPPVPAATSAIGIDVGVARFATLSNGTFYAPSNSFRRHEKALAKAQQALSRKVKFGRNWARARTRVQRLHARIANVRRDYLHKISTAISKNHAMVAIEDLHVRNMAASAAGTTIAPGRKVRAKSGLNKAILDQGWFEFRRQLEYKLAWNGGLLVPVPPANTSRTCPCCGHVSADNRPTQARFACVRCGFEEHADVVGAINVLRAGHARCACEVSDARRSPAAGTHRSDAGSA